MCDYYWMIGWRQKLPFQLILMTQLLLCLSTSGGSSRPSEDSQNRPQRNIFLLLYSPLNHHKVSVIFIVVTILHTFQLLSVSGLRGSIKKEPLSATLSVSCPAVSPLLIGSMWHERQENYVPTLPREVWSTPASAFPTHSRLNGCLKKKTKKRKKKRKIMMCTVICRFSESSCKRNVLVNSGVPCVDGSCRLVGYMIKMLKTV